MCECEKCGGNLSYSDELDAWECDVCEAVWIEKYDDCNCEPQVIDGLLHDDCPICGGTGFFNKHLALLE